MSIHLFLLYGITNEMHQEALSHKAEQCSDYGKTPRQNQMQCEKTSTQLVIIKQNRRENITDRPTVSMSLRYIYDPACVL